MRAILEYCTDRATRPARAGALLIQEGGRDGHLFVLAEGRLEVLKGDNVVAALAEPGAVVGEMSILLDQPHSATVRAACDSIVYEFDSAEALFSDHPQLVLLIARMLAQRLNVATTYLAELMQQYA